MQLTPLELLDTARNRELFRFLAVTKPSAHSDLVDALLRVAAAALGDYQVICPLPASYSYTFLSTKGVGFALAHGMSALSIAVPQTLVRRALDTGATAEPRIGAQWITLELFRADWPQPDLHFWLLKAYSHARHPAD